MKKNKLTATCCQTNQQTQGNNFPIPDFAGFGDIALTKQNGFDVINAAKPFIQILQRGSAD